MSITSRLHFYLQLLCFRNVGLTQHGFYKVQVTVEYLDGDIITLAPAISCHQFPDSIDTGAELVGKATIDQKSSRYDSAAFYVESELEEAKMNDICCFEAHLEANSALRSSVLSVNFSLLHCLARVESLTEDSFTCKSTVKVHISRPLTGVHEWYEVVFPEEGYSTLDVVMHTTMAGCTLHSDVCRDLQEQPIEQVERPLRGLFDRLLAPIVQDLEKLQGTLADMRPFLPEFASIVTLTQEIFPTGWSETGYQVQRYWDYLLGVCLHGSAEDIAQRFQEMLLHALFYISELVAALIRVSSLRPEIVQAYYQEKYAKYRSLLFNYAVVPNKTIVDSPPLRSPVDQEAQQKTIANSKRINPLPVSMSPIFEAQPDIQLSTLPVLFADYYESPHPAEEEKPQCGFHLIVLVNGYMGSWMDLVTVKNYIGRKYNQRVGFLLSRANEGDETKHDIMEMGRRLAIEVRDYIAEYCAGDLGRVSFVGYSLGGVIIRAALVHLDWLQEKMFTFLTLSSPHLGLMYSSSILVDTGVWFLRVFTDTLSLDQLAMKDSAHIETTLLYQLSTHPGLQWFQHVALFSSSDDNYSPIESSRIELTEKAAQGSEKGCYFVEMAGSLLANIKPERFLRVNVDFVLSASLDHFVGRKAHLEFLKNPQFLTILTENFPQLFL